MNLLPRLACAAALVLATAAHAADSFTGTITMKMTTKNGTTMVMHQSIKGSVMRVDLDTGKMPVSSIIDFNARTMTIVMHQQHMYMVRPMPTVDQARSMRDNGAPEKTPDVESTGRTEVILGHKCNEYIVKDGQNTTDLWLAPDLGVFHGLFQQGGGGSPFARGRSSDVAAKWEQVFKGKPGYPLRVVTKDADGEGMTMEVTDIKEGGVSDADLTPPDGYRKFEMPAGMGGFMPGGGR